MSKRSILDLLGDDGLDAFIKRVLDGCYQVGRLECIPAEDPNDMDTIGSLIDKLTTVNLKMWHNQEVLYEIRRMSAQEFKDRYEDGLNDLHATIKRCCDLNVQRSKLVDAIDKLAAEISRGEREAEVFEQHKTY